MMVRRDIADLEKENVVDVFFGGISLKSKESSHPDYEIENEINEMREEKKRIAQKAVSLIEPNDVILVDTGTTTRLMIDYIPNDINLIVYCYALDIIAECCRIPNLKVVACGGYFHSNTRMFESEEGADLIKKTHINKVFMAARGVSKEVGITTAEPYEVNLKKTALSNSEKRILLVDSTKFGKAWYAKYAEIDDFDTIITDSSLEAEHRKVFEDKKTELILV
jgi:DeoR family deoxyribose operon repressor